jgi:hypothetical protein
MKKYILILLSLLIISGCSNSELENTEIPEKTDNQTELTTTSEPIQTPKPTETVVVIETVAPTPTEEVLKTPERKNYIFNVEDINELSEEDEKYIREIAPVILDSFVSYGLYTDMYYNAETDISTLEDITFSEIYFIINTDLYEDSPYYDFFDFSYTLSKYYALYPEKNYYKVLFELFGIENYQDEEYKIEYDEELKSFKLMLDYGRYDLQDFKNEEYEITDDYFLKYNFDLYSLDAMMIRPPFFIGNYNLNFKIMKNMDDNRLFLRIIDFEENNNLSVE